MTPRPAEVEQAAGLLGIEVFDLGVALRRLAEIHFERETRKVRDYEMPNHGSARRLMRAAIACDEAWNMVREARLTARKALENHP